jgi:N-acyl-D-aspartate/D-glutamate deacylase
VIDLLIRGAELFDGSGAPPRHADVAVVEGRIARIAPRLGDAQGARRIVEADGLALMPGIVDSHTHFDAQITWDPTLSPSPALGVTTAVIGNCGFTIAPCRPGDREITMRNLKACRSMRSGRASPGASRPFPNTWRSCAPPARWPTSPRTSVIRRCALG